MDFLVPFFETHKNLAPFNLAPFQKVIIKGIMPNLEGMYIITNTRESITPQGFQTILEGSLFLINVNKSPLNDHEPVCVSFDCESIQISPLHLVIHLLQNR